MKRWWLGILLLVAWGVPVGAQTPIIPATDQVLVWVKPQDTPGGQLVLFTETEATVILQTPSSARRVLPCGVGTSPNGQYFAFYVGDDNRGTLFLMSGTSSELVNVYEGLSAVSCVGRNLQFSGDSTLMGFLVFGDTVGSDPSPRGRLFVYNIEDGALALNQENVTNFNMTQSGAVWVNFFLGRLNRAVEMAVQVWDGTTSREVSTLFADEANDCYYTTASIYALPNDRLTMTTGYKCGRGNNLRHQWQAYLIDIPTKGTTELLRGDAGGPFFGTTRTTSVFALGDAMYFTAADGLDSNTGSVFATSLSTPAVLEIVPRYGLMPSVNVRRNHPLMVSPDGRFLAVVANDPNNNATLYIVDMGAPNLPPITISAGTRGSVVEELLFTPDSKKLFFVAGSASPNNNATFIVDLLTGTTERITRGRFGQGAISPDGDRVAIVNFGTLTDREPAYPTLTVLNLADGGTSVLYVGATLTSANRVTNLQTLSVLSWRRGET